MHEGGHEVKPIKVYAGYNMNQDVRLSSSSGAVFLYLQKMFSLRTELYMV